MIRYCLKRLAEHRARWSARVLLPHVRPGDRVLDIGAGDCRLAQRVAERGHCEVVPVDVDDFNATALPLVRFDGRRLPFPDASFDVAMLVFVLHHAEDARAVLKEALRVTRRRVLVIEDVNRSRWDRWHFRAFHRLLALPLGISYPHHELTPAEWTRMAESVGLRQDGSRDLGRQLGPLVSRHLLYVWSNPAAEVAAAA